MTYFKQILEQATQSTALAFNKGLLIGLAIVVVCVFIQWAGKFSIESNSQRRERRKKLNLK